MERIEIVEKWYANRFERYVREEDGSLRLIEWCPIVQRPFLPESFADMSFVGTPRRSTETNFARLLTAGVPDTAKME